MKELAIVTVFFNYPEDRQPICLDNALKFFDKEDIFIARFSGLPPDASYYEKLYRYKIEYLLPYIKENVEGKYKYILFIDALDVNFYRDPKNLVSDFLDFNKSIVFCAEKEMWPLNSYTHLYETKPQDGFATYLNSGIYIGYTEEVIKHLTDIIEKDYPEKVTDQSIWCIQYLLYNDIELDRYCKLFFSTHRSKDNVFVKNNKVHILNMNPYLVHDNGPFSEETTKITHLL